MGHNIDDTVPAAIVILSQSAFATAKRIRDDLPHSVIYSLAGRVPQNDNEYNEFSEFIQTLYKAGRPVIALCAAGIVIRSLAPLLSGKSGEPPVIAVAGDGSCVVPLLGVTGGANRLAQKLALTLSCPAAVTTSGALHFGLDLLCPPADLALVNHENGKRFIADLLNGATVRLEGHHPWLERARLPVSAKAGHVIRILSHGDHQTAAETNELVYRRVSNRPGGRVSIVGLGPGAQRLRTLAAERTLKEADDILGYDYYIDLAGPFAPHQIIHKSDNRQELVRARHALALAAQGRHAVLISSGDPGVYAMAAAVFEAWEQPDIPDDPETGAVEIVVEPGISAAFAAAARLGAPLGHDFAVVSLSDNLKSWEMIEKRLRLASKADMVLALYNPVSRARRAQLSRAIEILRQERQPDTIVALAQDISRKGESLQITTLEQLQFQDITSRTVILVGSSRTRRFRKNGCDWVYTPRRYHED